MADFTINTYKNLLSSLKAAGYSIQFFSDFLKAPKLKSIILRHDVDKLPENSLVFAKIQAELGIKGSYYFRAVSESWDDNVIRRIMEMGHEVGYHYEDVDFAVQNLKNKDKREKIKVEEIVDLAIESFEINLEKLRTMVPVKTICMHGSPLSKFDNKLLWKKYDYRDYGIIGEPYFDIDFSKILYLTDTGRRWDGGKVSVRDKVREIQDKRQKSKDKSRKKEGVRGRFGEGEKGRLGEMEKDINKSLNKKPSTLYPAPSTNNLADRYHFHSTFDIIKAAEAGELPDQIMFTFHPQRWTDKPWAWAKELVLQNIKNVIKRILVLKQE